jgi:citrate lyase subunit beta / citryl-CoA lyase
MPDGQADEIRRVPRATRTSTVANEVFTPTVDEITEANAIIADYRHAEAGGVGAIGRDGRLVDAALMRHAENVLRRAAT